MVAWLRVPLLKVGHLSASKQCRQARPSGVGSQAVEPCRAEDGSQRLNKDDDDNDNDNNFDASCSTWSPRKEVLRDPRWDDTIRLYCRRGIRPGG
jgi:hypothetical protein